VLRWEHGKQGRPGKCRRARARGTYARGTSDQVMGMGAGVHAGDWGRPRRASSVFTQRFTRCTPRQLGNLGSRSVGKGRRA
jgi:hypothetical protein